MDSVRDAEMNALGERLQGYENDLANVEARRNRLVTSHQPEPKVDEMRRNLDYEANSLKEKIRDTHSEMLELEEQRRETDQVITEQGLHATEDNLDAIAERVKEGKHEGDHDQPNGPATEPHGQPPTEPQSAPHGQQGDWYRPGDWQGQPAAPDAAPPHPHTPDSQPGIAMSHDWAQGADHHGGAASPIDAAALATMVVASYVSNRFFPEKEKNQLDEPGKGPPGGSGGGGAGSTESEVAQSRTQPASQSSDSPGHPPSDDKIKSDFSAAPPPPPPPPPPEDEHKLVR